jgi:2-polyprenyl-3-methyl-5-hydroxy-6-metoxy-1,4-benzoquinol methylase
MKYHYDEFNHNQFESHQLAFGLVEAGAKVLDVGCATGYFARELSKKNCETWGVDTDVAALKKAAIFCKKVMFADADKVTRLPFPKKHFDYILFLDVIEHIQHPENILKAIKPHLKNNGRVLISVPNVAHASIRWMLLKGEFAYTSTGIMDKTHVHFYTKNSIVGLLKKNGFKVTKVLPTNGMCKVPFLYKITDRLPASWQYFLVNKAPNLFSFQFIVEAHPAG